ncbi:MAG: hypothetical protein ABIA12_02595 [Candidatus Aenigmatarchaeota archaeon]
MRIDFFEEFPTKRNMAKVGLIDFRSTIYVAARSLAEFRGIERRLGKAHRNIELAYWPITKGSYWISPFAHRHELEKLFDDLGGNRRKLKVLFDLELPMMAKSLFVRNARQFLSNKRLIESRMSDLSRSNTEILTAEYPAIGRRTLSLMRTLGVSASMKKFKHRKIFMCYSSIYPKRFGRLVRGFISKEVPKNKMYHVAVGLIKEGILSVTGRVKRRRLLTPEGLDRDLSFLERAGVGSATIFRLGGLDTEYLDVIRKYTRVPRAVGRKTSKARQRTASE